MRGRDLALPLFVVVAVTGFVGYLWFQGRAHVSEFVVTGGRVEFVEATDPAVPEALRAEAPADRMLLVDVTWEAAEEIDGGSYYVVAAVPPGWESFACEPECDWGTTPDLERYAEEALPVSTYPEGARFPADQSGRVQVAFVPGDGGVRRDPAFEPAAWLVQTDGDNVLNVKLIS